MPEHDPAPSPAEPSPTPADREATAEISATMDLTLRLGEVLQSSGAGASDVKAAMNNVAWALGLRRFTADLTFTELTATQQSSTDRPAIVAIRQVRYREIDYGDLTEVDHLIHDIVAGDVDRAEAAARLGRIVSTGHSRPRWAVTAALGAMGAGVAMVLGGDWLVVLLAAGTAMLVDAFQRRLARRRLPAFYQQVSGGLLATLIAVAVAATPAEVSTSLVISTGIVVLLAGVNFLGAIQDALTGFPVTAGARILEALMATAGVVAGVSGGLQVADVLGVPLGSVDPGVASIADVPAMVVGGALAAGAYAYSAYAPLRSLAPIAAVAGAAVVVYAVVQDRGFSVAWSSALAALLLGGVGYPVAERVRVPSLVVVAAGITPFLPGLSIFRGLTLLGQSPSVALLAITTAVTIAIALSSGAILGEYLAQPIRHEAQRLERRLAGPRLVGPHTVLSGRRRRRGRRPGSPA